MTKYVLAKLSFKNAKFFAEKKISHVPYGFGIITHDSLTPKHGSIDINSRTVCPENTVPKHCVANLVSVLMGDRPIPAKKACSPIAVYDQTKYNDIASRCFVEILTDKVNKSTLTTNKSYYAHSTESTLVQLELDGEFFKLGRSCPTHQTMSLAWCTEKYPNEYLDFDNFCIDVLGADYKVRYSFVQTLTELRKLFVAKNAKLNKFIESKEGNCSNGFDRDFVKIVKEKVVSDSAFRMENYSNSSKFAAWLACPPTHGSPELATVVSGNIYMKLTEAEWIAMLKGPMYATFMDGGYVAVPTVCEAWNETYESLPTPYEPSKD
jgi:hypothetical protein